MVRRWSFINEINTHSITLFKPFRITGLRVVFRENVHYKRKLRLVSFMARRSWARRKHTHQWLLYYSVLANWSADYRFFIRYSKSMLTQNLFKNSFLTYNFLMIKNLPSALCQGSEYFISSFLTRRVYTYFLQYRVSRLNIFNFIKNYNILLLTQPGLSNTNTPMSVTKINATYQYTQNMLTSPVTQPALRKVDNTVYLVHIFNMLNSLVLINTVSLYKIHILLTLKTFY